MMKSYKEFIAERNPYHPGKMTIEKFEQFLKNGYYMTFVELEKVGINPKSKYSTPLGLYTYPLYAREFIKAYNAATEFYGDEYGKSDSDKFLKAITKSVPFMGDNPNYLYVIQENKSAKIYHTSRGDYTWDDIKSSATLTVLEKYVSKSVTVDKEGFDLILSGETPVTVLLRGHREIDLKFDTPSGHLANDDMEPLCFIWGLTRFITSRQGSRSMKLWAQCLLDLGIDGISDDAALGLIHEAEPFQAVFFNMGAISKAERISLKTSSVHKKETTDQRDLNVALKILKSGRFPKKISKLLQNTLFQSENTHSLRDIQKLWYAVLMSDNEEDVYNAIHHVSNAPNLLRGFLPSAVMEIVQRDDVFEKNPDALTMLLPGYKKFAVPFARKHICKSAAIPRELISKFDDGYPEISPDDLPAIKKYIDREDFVPDARGLNLLRKGGIFVDIITFVAVANEEQIINYLKVHPKAIEYLPENKFSKKLVVELLGETFAAEAIGKFTRTVIPFQYLDEAFSDIEFGAARRLQSFIFGIESNTFLGKKERMEQAEHIEELLETPAFKEIKPDHKEALLKAIFQITK